MPDITPGLSPNEPDRVILERLLRIRRACLAVAGLVAMGNLCVWLIPGLRCAISVRWHLMGADAAAASVLCAISLYIAENRESRRIRQISIGLALLAALPACAILAGYEIPASLGMPGAACGALAESLQPLTAGAFVLLAFSIALVGARVPMAIRIADLAVFALCLIALILISGYLFGALRVFGLSSELWVSPQTLLCLALLTQAVLLRRAETGVFSIFLGQGIGSRIARALIPVLLVLPFLREAGRAHLVQAQLIPAHYATAILASVATMLSLLLLLYLAWRINAMELEIHDLSLRDSLTGLYNLRGFTLLAEQSLRMAQRSELPFSVLYLDVDNLKLVNDTMGHEMGSSFLTETGQLMKAAFRETDVMGRIGGDEFALAGHFSQVAISIASERLKAACTVRNAETGRKYPLAFSVGYVTATEHSHETLRDLMAAADQAMYAEKRRRNVGRN
jgi:diguanylate cyclase (GGDEF)-like protein